MISDATKEQHPDIPWVDMVGMRNRLIHEYFDIDLATVWDTVQNDLPELVRQLERIVPPD